MLIPAKIHNANDVDEIIARIGAKKAVEPPNPGW
jgi:hypothetical protein